MSDVIIERYMKPVFLIIGRSAVGKSEITNRTAKALNMNVLKSYCTRPRRANEIGEDVDHTFISPEDVSKYKDDIVAYFKREDAELFATKTQVQECDFYIINPHGVNELKKYNIPNIRYIEVYIRVPKIVQTHRAIQRGDSIDSFLSRYDEENEQFLEYEKEAKFDYHILNDGTIDEAVQKLCNIVQKELSHDN